MAGRGIGQMRERVGFDRSIRTPDGSGGFTREWEEEHVCAAEFIYSRGSETVIAARLEGRTIYKIRVHQSVRARKIEPHWRMRDLRRGTQYNVREIDMITDQKWVYLVVESGAAI
ncbi:MAG: head-tail adaptor protein [Epibacterium sp.]